MFRSIDTAASGMTAERLRLDVISNNLANVNTTRTAAGGPYRRQQVVFAPREEAGAFSALLQQQLAAGSGVRVTGIVQDESPLKSVYDPQHPDADASGYVQMPNVNVVAEMVDMMTASRAYEANVAAVNAAKTMALKALDIGK